MIIVIDVNPLMSALIKDSAVRRVIANSDLEFCFPEPALQKIRKYKDYILEKSGLSELEYLVILYTLLRFIRIIPLEEIINNWNEAKKIMERIDPEDVVFIATALSQEDVFIWSDDKHFEKQDKVKIWKTKDLLDYIKSQ